jgi:hypothetical protein
MPGSGRCSPKREGASRKVRAASQIAGDRDVLIIGSQSALGAIPEDRVDVSPAVRQRLRHWIARYDKPASLPFRRLI